MLYELFTGRPAFEAHDVAGAAAAARVTPRDHAVVARARDRPMVERAILRCLEPDPQQRPSSALEVAASLPGGNPLAEALAAGETPSPEMVAAAGPTEGIAAANGRLAAGRHRVGLAMWCWLTPPTQMVSQLPSSIRRNAGVQGAGDCREPRPRRRPVDTASGFRDETD